MIPDYLKVLFAEDLLDDCITLRTIGVRLCFQEANYPMVVVEGAGKPFAVCADNFSDAFFNALLQVIQSPLIHKGSILQLFTEHPTLQDHLTRHVKGLTAHATRLRVVAQSEESTAIHRENALKVFLDDLYS